MTRIAVQHEDFDTGEEMAQLGAGGTQAGAVSCFVGVVRSTDARPIIAMTLEHYPGMTEAALARMAKAAETRFALLSCAIIHRVGTLLPGERIVFVGAAATHRAAALQAVPFLVDWLKSRAPFWKKEILPTGQGVWVQARQTDEEALSSWS